MVILKKRKSDLENIVKTTNPYKLSDDVYEAFQTKKSFEYTVINNYINNAGQNTLLEQADKLINKPQKVKPVKAGIPLLLLINN